MFGKRYNLLNIFGFKIGIDLSWFLIAFLLSWTLASGYFPMRYPGLTHGLYWTMGVLGMLGLFVCVILHEMGHAFVARHFKLPSTHITLFIFGGVAEIKKEPTSPKVEFLVAIAGPIVSFAIAFVLYFVTKAGEAHAWPVAITGITGYLALINLLLAIFNLLPAFPLDGGRIFRSILWGWKKNFGWATKVASAVGAGFGIALVFLGFFAFLTGNLIAGIWWVILGLFLQKAAKSSLTQFYVGRELQGEKVVKFMIKNSATTPPDITLKEFVSEHVYKSCHHLYPVVENEKLLGLISLREVKSVPHEDWGKVRVKAAMVPRSNFQTVSPDTNAMEALNLIQQVDPPILMVEENGRFIGILTGQDLFKLISLKLELEEEFRR